MRGRPGGRERADGTADGQTIRLTGRRSETVGADGRTGRRTGRREGGRAGGRTGGRDGRAGAHNIIKS